MDKYKSLLIIIKKFLTILALSLCFISTSKADDIKDFQVEGISIGDSLLNFFSKSEIEKKGSYLYPNKDMKAATFKDSSFKNYDKIQFHWLSKDKLYKIQSISANIEYKKDISSCLKQRKIINKEIKSLFDSPKENDWGKRVLKNVDPSLQTFAYQNIYWFRDGNIIVSCRDYGKNKEEEGRKDYLAVMIDSIFFEDWLNNKAWN